MQRRTFIITSFAALTRAAHSADGYPEVALGRMLEFPRDHGAHPKFRTEWWYITGWLRDAQRELGFQITFFRSRPRVAENISSAFAPKQLLFAHAALADPRSPRLIHEQKAARAGFGLAEAREDSTNVFIGDWSLRLEGETYRAKIAAREFTLDLNFTATQPLLLQGENGYSRKGPEPQQASHYYSRPHLAVSGVLEQAGRPAAVRGTAWLDHEWSSEYLAAAAAGWDWVGVNLDDGSAVMAFRIRGKDGGVFWAGGAVRSADGAVRILKPDEVRFEPLRHWRSPRSGAKYPIAMRVWAGDLEFMLEPLLADQELDTRGSTGTLYWEGAMFVRAEGDNVGRGYLELTGYWQPLNI